MQKLALIGRHPVPLGVAGGEGQDEWAEFEHKPKVRSVSSAQQDDAKCIAGAVVGLVSDVGFVKQCQLVESMFVAYQEWDKRSLIQL